MLTESDQELPEDVTEEAVPTKSKSAADIALDIAMIILAPILIPTTFGLLTFLEIKESRKACLDCKSRKLTPWAVASLRSPLKRFPKTKVATARQPRIITTSALPAAAGLKVALVKL